MLQIEYLVLDYNGTLALDGRLIPGVRPHLRTLARLMELHVVTADIFGTVRRARRGTESVGSDHLKRSIKSSG
jgi:hypothetical protein